MGKREQWDLKVSPARYLLDRRRGTHADLALRLVTADLNKTRRRRVTLLKLALIAFSVLCEQLGKDVMDVETHEAVVRDWIRECIATVTSRLDDDAWDLWLLCGKDFDMKEQEQKTAESIIKNCVPRCKGYGLLGAPRVIEVYPPFWKLNMAPSRYLERLGGTKKHAQQARAAVKPFEDVIWQEIKQVEAALCKAMSSQDASRDGDAILGLALTKAHHSIGYNRYHNNWSPENVSSITFWIAHLAPLSASR
jgi:hypothetical protein